MAGAIEETDFELLVCCPTPLSRDQLLVDFSPTYDRVPHPDQLLEQAIEKVWEQRIASQPSLYSATKFRYAGCQKVFLRNKVGDHEGVVLQLGLTDYKFFIGTNLSPIWERYLAEADEDRLKHMASPLGNGAIVETADHHILILHRSMDVGEFPGYVVFPGGHSEPKEVGIESHSVRKASSTAELMGAIEHEMFEGITREVVEETGVPAATLSDPVFLGVSRRKLNARPTAFFYVTCDLTCDKVMEAYNQAEHTFESFSLRSTVPDVLLKGDWKMPGCHQGGIALYRMMREAQQKPAQQ